jgi:hypothetical protein
LCRLTVAIAWLIRRNPGLALTGVLPVVQDYA